MAAFDDDFAAVFADLETELGDTVSIQPVSGPAISFAAVVESSTALEDRDGVVFRVYRVDLVVAVANYPTRSVGDKLTFAGRVYQSTGNEEIDGDVVVVTFERREAAQFGESSPIRRG